MILSFVLNGVLALGIGLFWSLLPRKLMGLTGFCLFYLAIVVLYAVRFNLQTLLYDTFFSLYVAVGLIGFVLGTRLVLRQRKV